LHPVREAQIAEAGLSKSTPSSGASAASATTATRSSLSEYGVLSSLVRALVGFHSDQPI
jgi:hypothetical protein